MAVVVDADSIKDKYKDMHALRLRLRLPLRLWLRLRLRLRTWISMRFATRAGAALYRAVLNYTAVCSDVL